jgi:hypothetical protein
MKLHHFILLAILGMSIWAWNSDRKIRANYICYDVKGKIVKMGEDNCLTQDKFHKPQFCETVLVQTLNDTTLFFELSTCDPNCPVINHAWYQNHQVGDPIYMKTIKKERFFHINKK